MPALTGRNEVHVLADCVEQESLEAVEEPTVSGRGGEAATRGLPAPAPSRHLLSSMAVYTAWGDTEKNRSSRSSQVSSVSCRADGPRGQPTVGSWPGCPCRPCWGRRQEPKALGSNVASDWLHEVV